MMFADDIVICSESRWRIITSGGGFPQERRGMKVRRVNSPELEVAEIKMLRFSVGVTKMDRIRNENI